MRPKEGKDGTVSRGTSIGRLTLGPGMSRVDPLRLPLDHIACKQLDLSVHFSPLKICIRILM